MTVRLGLLKMMKLLALTEDCKSCLEKAFSFSTFTFHKHHSSNIFADFLARMVTDELILKESSALKYVLVEGLSPARQWRFRPFLKQKITI